MQEIGCAHFQRPQGSRDRCAGADDDNGKRKPGILHFGQQFEAGNFRHVQIGDDATALAGACSFRKSCADAWV